MLYAGRIESLLIRFFEPEILAWRGEANLVTVSWGYGVVASSALIVLHIAALMLRQIALQRALLQPDPQALDHRIVSPVDFEAQAMQA